MDEHTSHYGGPERFHIDTNLRLDDCLLCPLEMDPHITELTPAAGGLDHPMAHSACEHLPRHPVAARQQPTRLQGLEPLVGPQLDGLPEGHFLRPPLGPLGWERRGRVAVAYAEDQPGEQYEDG